MIQELERRAKDLMFHVNPSVAEELNEFDEWEDSVAYKHLLQYLIDAHELGANNASGL